MHILSADQFDRGGLEEIFDLTDQMRADFNSNRAKLAKRHINRQVALLFYEPSTRTRLSFSFGAQHMGMHVNSTENAKEFSSAAKGETLEDTIVTLNQFYPDFIVIRHHETGVLAQAVEAVETVPIINAGDGKGEHPTQALLDAYTILREQGRLDNLKVVLGGDLKNGRTARSLAKTLAQFDGNHLIFASTRSMQMSEDVKHYLQQRGTTFEEVDNLEDALVQADVVYWTRLQKERLEVGEEPEQDKPFIINKKVIKLLPKKAILMHPLPRVGEITHDVDSDSRAKYFPQVRNGMFIRMALMDRILKSS